jgi:hypothetical protein
MDKIKKYQDVIIDFLNRYNSETGRSLENTGWRGGRYIFGPIFHFDIINGKIWMQCNNTEREVVDELMAAGVERSDIVLGFVPPAARHFLGFAEA